MFERVSICNGFLGICAENNGVPGRDSGNKRNNCSARNRYEENSLRGRERKCTYQKSRTNTSRAKKRLKSIGKTVKTKVKVGIPSREILRIVDEESPSLVVMGARGMSLIKDILLGSVSSDVLRYGKTNLLIMRHKIAEQLERGAFERCWF